MPCRYILVSRAACVVAVTFPVSNLFVADFCHWFLGSVNALASTGLGLGYGVAQDQVLLLMWWSRKIVIFVYMYVPWINISI